MSNKPVIGTVQAACGVDPEGLSDGGHVYPSCSNCRATLMDIWITRPHEPEKYRIRALCPWCGDTSFVVTVQGGFHQGGYGVIKPDNEDEDVASTIVDRFEIIDGVLVFFVQKASAHAKPVVRR